MKAQKLFKQLTLAIVIVASFVIFQSFTGHHHLHDKKTDSVSSQVNYLGADEQYFLFEVIVNDQDSGTNNSLRINIQANNQDDIFDERYQAGKMTRIFKIIKTDIGNISFYIFSKHKTAHYHFDIERTYKEQVNVIAAKQD